MHRERGWTEKMKPTLRARTFELLGYKYSYGWLVWKDKKCYIGIEREAL